MCHLALGFEGNGHLSLSLSLALSRPVSRSPALSLYSLPLSLSLSAPIRPLCPQLLAPAARMSGAVIELTTKRKGLIHTLLLDLSCPA